MSNSVKTTAVAGTFADKVLGFLGMGDGGKVTRFHKKYTKDNEKQISLRVDEVEVLKEELNDLTESSEEAILQVDLDRIQSTGDIASYISSYREIQIENIRKAKAITKKIAHKEEEIALFEELNNAVK